MSTQTDLFVEFDYGHDVRALIRYPLLAVNDENVDPTVSRYGLWRNGWVHLVIAVTTSLKPEPAVSATCPKEPCVRVVGRSKVVHERIVKNSSRRLLSREACASCRQSAPRAVLRVCSVAVRGTLKGAPEPAAGNLAWGPRRWL